MAKGTNEQECNNHNVGKTSDRDTEMMVTSRAPSAQAGLTTVTAKGTTEP